MKQLLTNTCIGFCFLLTASATQAQIYGLVLGAGASTFNSPTAEVQPDISLLEDYNSTWSSTVAIGFSLIQPINSHFSVESGIQFGQKGTRENWSQVFTSPTARDSLIRHEAFDEYRVSYLHVPLILNHDKSGFFAGFVVSKAVYLKFQRYLDIRHYYEGREVFNNTDVDGYDGNLEKLTFVNPYELSWTVGYKYHVKNYMHLGFGLSSSVTQVFQTGAAPWLNYRTTELRFSIRYLFNVPVNSNDDPSTRVSI